MINWKVRIKNKNFWITVIPAIILLIQVVANVFDFHLDLSETQQKLIDVINAVFSVLTVMGIIQDPTTAGISDSSQAMTYDTPKEG